MVGLWPFNFTEKNNAVISPAGGLEIARHGSAYTAAPSDKIHHLKQFTIDIDLATSSDGLDSLEKIFGYLISQEDVNLFLAQWKDGLELRVRTERNAAGMIFGADGVLEKENRTACLIIYDGQKMHLYANGALVRRDNRGPLSFSNWSQDYPLVVGTDANGRSQWRGTLFEVAIFDRALTSKEVKRLSGPSRLSGLSGRIEEKSQSEIAAHPAGARTDTGKVASGQWSVASAGEQQDKRPLIHYVFKTENTYEKEFRGRKALAVRDLGKGEPADLVIPERFAPYKRVYLGWDPDWMKRSSEWVDLVVNVMGFVPFGMLLIFAAGKKKCLSVLMPECLSEEKEGTRDEGAGTSAATRQNSRQLTADSRQPKVQNRAARHRVVVAVILAVAAGFVVSFMIEYLQAYLPSRDSSLRDLITNVLGTALGAITAAWLLRNRSAAVIG